MLRDVPRGGAEDSPSCPRATLAFVGRDAELARVAELLDEEVVFLIYGVAGIGKTELAYRAIELARARPGWSDAIPTLVQVQPGMTEHHLVAVLRSRTGADGNHGDRLPGHARSLALAAITSCPGAWPPSSRCSGSGQRRRRPASPRSSSMSPRRRSAPAARWSRGGRSPARSWPA